MTAPLSPKALKRLQKIERTHGRRAVKLDRPSFLVDVQKLWDDQEGRCCCDRVDYPGCRRLPLNPNVPGTHPDGISFAHLQHMAGAGEGPHKQENCGLMRTACNVRMAGRENHDAGVYRKMMADMGLSDKPDPFLEPKPKRKLRWPSRPMGKGQGFWKPEGAKSKLSKEYRREVLEKMK